MVAPGQHSQFFLLAFLEIHCLYLALTFFKNSAQLISQGHPTSIFGKYLFGRRFEIQNFPNICCKVSCLPAISVFKSHPTVVVSFRLVTQRSSSQREEGRALRDEPKNGCSWLLKETTCKRPCLGKFLTSDRDTGQQKWRQTTQIKHGLKLRQISTVTWLPPQRQVLKFNNNNNKLYLHDHNKVLQYC